VQRELVGDTAFRLLDRNGERVDEVQQRRHDLCDLHGYFEFLQPRPKG